MNPAIQKLINIYKKFLRPPLVIALALFGFVLEFVIELPFLLAHMIMNDR